MLKRIAITIILMALAGHCFAQSNLVLYDADGDRIGPVLQIIDSTVTTYTPDGFLLKVDMVQGFAGAFVSYFYPNANCTGTASPPFILVRY